MYTRVRQLDPCRLSKEELTRVSEIIQERVSGNDVRPATASFSVHSRDFDITKDSIAELFAVEGLPSRLHTLVVTSTKKAPDGEDIERLVELAFLPTVLSCTVSGTDDHWVRGMFDEVISLLRVHRPQTWPIRKFFSVIFFTILGALIGFWVGAQGSLPLPYLIPLFGTYVLIIFLNSLHRKGSFLAYSDVVLIDKRSPITVGRAGFVLSVITTLITVIGFVRSK